MRVRRLILRERVRRILRIRGRLMRRIRIRRLVISRLRMCFVVRRMSPVSLIPLGEEGELMSVKWIRL